jgi:hypothetical protein
MVRVTFWPQMLLAALMLRQSAAASDQCSELQDEISRLERDVENITLAKHANEFLARQCYVSSYTKSWGFCKLVLLFSNAHVPMS